MIKVQNLSKSFGSIRAVDNLSFECTPGEIYGLLGSNGAGKTTTIRMLATLLQPTSGSASINGFDIVTEGSSVRKNIGVLTGDAGLYHRLTAEENVRYFASLYDLDRKYTEERINELFELLEMAEYRQRRTDGFSKGMKQKVTIVRSIIHDPPVVFFDEPTAGLDVMSARSVLDFIARCRREGKCVILSTHIMSEAERLCDRIGIINRGQLVGEGSISELLKLTDQSTLEEAFVRLVGE
jgi:sodium transport system ATP-binding protein